MILSDFVLGAIAGAVLIGACWLCRETYLRAGGWHQYAINERRSVGLRGSRAP